MMFSETVLKGAYVIEIKPIADHRGFFARQWCKREFEEHGLSPNLLQVNLQFSHKKGTLRGMHFQVAPWQEAKLVRCTQGAILDVMIDLRPDSPTHRKWVAVELTVDNRKVMYVPEGFAHGYQTLTDEAEVMYQTSQFYAPNSATGVRYNDPAFGIQWPLPVSVVSSQDEQWPDYQTASR